MMKKILIVAACGMLCSLGINDVEALGKNSGQTIAQSQNSDIASFAAFCREKFEQIERILSDKQYKSTYKASLNIVKKYKAAYQALEDQKRVTSIEKLFNALPPFPVDVLQVPEVKEHAITMLKVLGERRMSQLMTEENKIDELCASLQTALGINDGASREYVNDKAAAARRVPASNGAVPVQQPVYTPQPVRTSSF